MTGKKADQPQFWSSTVTMLKTRKTFNVILLQKFNSLPLAIKKKPDVIALFTKYQVKEDSDTLPIDFLAEGKSHNSQTENFASQRLSPSIKKNKKTKVMQNRELLTSKHYHNNPVISHFLHRTADDYLLSQNQDLYARIKAFSAELAQLLSTIQAPYSTTHSPASSPKRFGLEQK